ncbi:MAG TPA: TlyA family RNA methyltransferase [Rhizomicrobium sp.]|jgi:23S rRNA (cytidine1920-2'-O)/16S rRNA (cytidine1409-2'-O)-methyltransferase
MRADVFLVEQGYAKSRSEAQAAIAAGCVLADGKPVTKPSQTLTDAARIEYSPAHPYVSRGAVKLAAALDGFGLSPAGLTCLDLGASTGGFTQVLLQRDAEKVFAVDVGHGQLDMDLAQDARVTTLEHRNARDLQPDEIVPAPQAIVADLSFISLKLALPPAMRMAAPGAWLVALFKPQFEVGRDNIAKGGIVKDDAARSEALHNFLQWMNAAEGWRTLEPGYIDSPIAGGDGNREFLVAARRSAVP